MTKVKLGMLDTMQVSPAPPAAPRAVDSFDRVLLTHPRTPARFVDPSASHARAPSLILQPPTVCASLTPLQA